MGRASGRAVTISAIAAEAGVSVPTVSRVLNGRSDVAPGTRERVEQLLRHHEYRRPSRRQGQACLIDLVFDDLDSPWALEIVRGVEEVVHAAGAGTVVSAIHSRASDRRQWLDNLRVRATDAVILVLTDLDGELGAELERLDVPAVAIDPAGVPALDLPTIGVTNWSGAVSATEHLIGLGHRRIAHISGRPGLWCTRSRLDGYRAGLSSAGLQPAAELVVEGDFGYESGYRAGVHLLGLAEPPTAVFAANDQMAMGVYEALRRSGRRVPDDVSVVGFDDLPSSRWASPPMTTVRQPLTELGRMASQMALRMVGGESIEGPRVELATELVVRESTAAR
ncbi:LacI family DNA-binding transcriptional regulator [Nocardioides sp. zg-1308]|uniref:LacI family DNA-binding transcriptional regulator n=1 Tax=Nocardioides sp. zg-1308 TaxID=2736253 RepID=UPI001554E31C|nr:LacI family DNA-binding transcriptional regulator [Nocardioides sp. zg-1308]